MAAKMANRFFSEATCKPPPPLFSNPLLLPPQNSLQTVLFLIFFLKLSTTLYTIGKKKKKNETTTTAQRRRPKDHHRWGLWQNDPDTWTGPCSVPQPRGKTREPRLGVQHVAATDSSEHLRGRCCLEGQERHAAGRPGAQTECQARRGPGRQRRGGSAGDGQEL